MKKILGVFISLLLCLPLLVQSVSAADAGFGPVDVNVTFVFDESNTVDGSVTGKAYGSYSSFSPATNPGYEFAAWVINGVVRSDLPENMSIKVTSNMDILALYKPVGEYGILFVDSNGKMIGNDFVEAGGSATAPSVLLPSKPGLSVKAEGMWMMPNGVTSFDNVQEDRIYTLQYESASSDQYMLTIDGGEATAYDYNSLVTVSADAEVMGESFAYWSLNGFPVSRDLDYTFTMLCDVDLVKVYDSSMADEPLVIMSDDLAIRSGYQ